MAARLTESAIVNLFFRGLCPLTPTKNLALQAVPKKGSGLQKALKALDK
jgi:hypothetical protein